MRRISIKKMNALLAELGSTSAEVYRSLKKLGVKGNRRCPVSCPIANFISSHLGGAPSVGAAIWTPEITKKSHILPKACQVFIKNFDDGKYKSLVAKQAAD